MRILYLESFYGGSHRDVADSIVRHSRHTVELRTLPARFWKWRMRGASLAFAHELAEAERRGEFPYDLVVCGGLMSIPDLLATSRRALPPVLLYAHETQLSYPAPDAREADLHFAFTDLTNMLAATHVAFNSHTHRDALLRQLRPFLRRLPEHRPMWAIDEIAAKSSVCYPGIRYTDAGTHPGDDARTHPGDDARQPPGDHAAPAPDPPSRGGPTPLVLWNHRWEFDKAPDRFFAALRAAKARGHRFRLVLAGENFQVVPKPFLAAREEFATEIEHYGYLPDRSAYERWLARADIVVSTAIQENFGISVMESIAHGARPLLPARLSYPELIPEQYREAVLYETNDELVEKLCRVLPLGEARATAEPSWRSAGQAPRARSDSEGPATVDGLNAVDLPGAPEGLARHARSFAWERRIKEFDALFERVAAGTSPDAGSPPRPGAAPEAMP